MINSYLQTTNFKSILSKMPNSPYVFRFHLNFLNFCVDVTNFNGCIYYNGKRTLADENYRKNWIHCKNGINHIMLNGQYKINRIDCKNG